MTQDTPRQHPGGVPVAPDGAVRLRLHVRGRVQGVGFRPFVYRLAGEMNLGGFVANDPRGALVEIEGPADVVRTFVTRLGEEVPPLAHIASLTEESLDPRGEQAFRILPSVTDGAQEAHITPDAATCDDCLAELRNPADRRHRYPFINCTNCGPRYSIVRTIPYDRRNTTMSVFTMCGPCQAEYDDPGDRRFHAQPNACGDCGPAVRLTDAAGRPIAGDAIAEAARRLSEGQILAVKGLGGFHLACRADDDVAVAELRRRKGRETKPLAVMAPSLEAAEQLVTLDAAARASLTGPERPIVLAPKRSGAAVSPLVAQISECFGVLLPYTPLHELLFAEGLGPLVMTSGNPSAEPLCCDNDEALNRLGQIADAFLLHDRDIRRRVDDSVVMAPPADIRSARVDVIPIRRARGLVPTPIAVPAAAKPILAVGAELKSTICLMTGAGAVLSEHLGDLTNPEAYRNFVGAAACLEDLLDVQPELVACDLHPNYASTRYARKLGLPVTAVQHHHAHIVSCMAEHGITGRVIGLACDGTGYGPDATVWGCEVLACDESEFHRVGHLRAFALPGGDAAAVETWRPALGLLVETFGADQAAWPDAARIAFDRVDAKTVELATGRLSSPAARAIRTSSLGRLFDAAAFLLGLCDRNRCEAQAPMAMEARAAEAGGAGKPLEWRVDIGADETIEIDPRPLVRSLLARVAEGRSDAVLAAAFHEALAQMLAAAANRAAERTALNRVVLSGGCFVNRLLLGRMWNLLRRDGREVYIHRKVPSGDGGVALGQAVAAAVRWERGGR